MVIDIGGRKQGFSSDITRMAIVGSAPEGRERDQTLLNNSERGSLVDMELRPGNIRAVISSSFTIHMRRNSAFQQLNWELFWETSFHEAWFCFARRRHDRSRRWCC